MRWRVTFFFARIKFRDVKNEIKYTRAKIFQPIDFFKFLLQSDHELLVSEMQKKKKLGVTVFISEIKRVKTTLILENWRA